jgi:hypothetical protein
MKLTIAEDHEVNGRCGALFEPFPTQIGSILCLEPDLGPAWVHFYGSRVFRQVTG